MKRICSAVVFSTLRQVFSNKNLVVLTIADVLFLFGGTLWWPFQPLYILELGASKEILGVLMMFQSATTIISQIPGGILADRYGRKKVIIFGSFTRCISPFIYVLSNHWIFLVPAMIIRSIAAVDMPAWNALLVESLPLERRGLGYGVHSTLISIPRIFTMPLAGFLLDSLGTLSGMRLCLVFNEILLVTYSLILWRFIAEKRERADYKEMRRTVIPRLKMLPTGVWIMMIVGGLVSFVTNLLLSFMVVYAVEIVELSKTEWGITGTIFNLMSTLLTTPSGFLADRIGRKTCILISNTASLFSTLIFIKSKDFGGVLFSRVLQGTGSGFGGVVWGAGGGPVWQTLIADLVPSEIRGSVLGLIGTMTGALGVPSTGVGGFLYDNFSPTLPFQLSIVLTGVAIMIFFLFLKEPKERLR